LSIAFSRSAKGGGKDVPRKGRTNRLRRPQSVRQMAGNEEEMEKGKVPLVACFHIWEDGGKGKRSLGEEEEKEEELESLRRSVILLKRKIHNFISESKPGRRAGGGGRPLVFRGSASLREKSKGKMELEQSCKLTPVGNGRKQPPHQRKRAIRSRS